MTPKRSPGRSWDRPGPMFGERVVWNRGRTKPMVTELSRVMGPEVTVYRFHADGTVVRFEDEKRHQMAMDQASIQTLQGLLKDAGFTGGPIPPEAIDRRF